MFIFISPFFQRGQVYIVDQVLANIRPPLFKLKDLNGHKLKPNFYSQQLKVAPDPDKVGFEIEKVIATRGSKDKKEYKVRYLFYGPKFDRWVKGANFEKRARYFGTD
jgi:hypothetical protein